MSNRFSLDTILPGTTSTLKSKGFTPLMIDVLNGKLNQENLNKTNIDDSNEESFTALMLASMNIKIEPKEYRHNLIKELLKNGANPNIQNKYGDTALMQASQYSNTNSTNEVVEILLKNDADPNIQNKEGSTALIAATFFSDSLSTEKTVEILLKNGAAKGINLLTNKGKTALMYAKSENVAKMLLEHGANLEDAKENFPKLYKKMKKEKNKNLENDIEKLKEQNEAMMKMIKIMWAVPGMPGSVEASEEFEMYKKYL